MNEINRKLLSAVEYGKLETLRDLLNQYGIGASEANGYVLLRNSVSSGSRYREITKLLLVNGSKANIKRNITHPSDTPLHYAVVCGDIETVELLLNYNADINVANESGLTPLMLAIITGKEKIFDILLDRGAYVSASCIHLAVQNRNITEKLLQLGVSINCTDNSGQQFTPLLSAAPQYVENSSVVELLLKLGANVNAVTTEGQTALHLASKHGHIETMEVLLRSKADVNARCKDMLTPLYLAVHAYQTDAAKLLMNHAADINFEFKNGETILNLAVSKGLSLIVKEVLKYSPDKNNATNKSALAIAANKFGNNYLEIVQDLIKYGFSVDQDDVEILIPKAIKASYINILQHILDHGLHLVCNEDANCYFLQIAVQCKNVEIVELFLTHGFNVDATDKLGKRALYYSVKNSDVVMTKLLLSHGASVQKSPELLRIATRNVCKDLVEILLQNKADIEATDEHGRTALHLNASQDQFINFFEVSYSGNCNFETKAEIAKMLLSMGANVDAKTKYQNQTALHIACSQTIPNVVEVLLEYKANVNCLVGDLSPLLIATEKGNASIMKMLIGNGACVNLKRNNGDSVLHILAKTNHTDVFKVLLENDADVYSTNSKGQTPLHYASCNPNYEIASLLLQNMSHSDLKDNEGRTPLVLAVKSFHSSIVKLLLDFGSDINVVPKDNYTILEILQNFRTQQIYFDDDDDYERYVDHCYDTYDETVNVLKKHFIKLRTAGLYVSKRNINSLRYDSEEFDDFLFDCECEINKIKQEKIANNKISLYDILTKNIHSLANYARNADVIQYFNSEDYKTKFEIYAPFIERNFKNGYRRRLLLEQGYEFFKCYLKLPIDCSERILTYLSDADLESIINIVSKMP